MKKQKSALLDQYVRSAVRGTKLKLALTATTGVALILFGGDFLSHAKADKEHLVDCTAKMAEAIHQNAALSQRIENQLAFDNKNKLADPLDIFYLETQKTNLAVQAQHFARTEKKVARLSRQNWNHQGLAYGMSVLGTLLVFGTLLKAKPLLVQARNKAVENGTRALYQKLKH